MFGADPTASSASCRHDRWQCQQYPWQRPLVTRAGTRLSDCNLSETVCSRPEGERQETLQSNLSIVIVAGNMADSTPYSRPAWHRFSRPSCFDDRDIGRLDVVLRASTVRDVDTELRRLPSPLQRGRPESTQRDTGQCEDPPLSV